MVLRHHISQSKIMLGPYKYTRTLFVAMQQKIKCGLASETV